MAVTDYYVKQYRWSSQALLREVRPEDIAWPQEMRDSHREQFWRNMATEYDARNLVAYLDNSGLDLSEEFRDFLRVWDEDEKNHYQGLKRLIELIYEDRHEDILDRLHGQVVDFGPIEQFIRDEFEILVLLALDEINSARGYLKVAGLYDTIGPPAVGDWVRRAAKDEAVHARNALKLIEWRHANRVADIPDYLERLLGSPDVKEVPYQATFIFDYDGDDYSMEDLRSAGRAVMQFFRQ